MMKRINLFVACTKDSGNLIELKGKIKSLCLVLNKSFAKDGRNVKICPVTYDDPEHRKDVGKKFIKHKADIVIFLIGQDIDESLQKELDRAVSRCKDLDGPELIVYTFNEEAYKKVEELLGKTGGIYHQPKDEDTFMENVKNRLTEYVRKYKSRRRIINRLKFFLLVLITTAIVFASFSFYFRGESNRWENRWEDQYKQRRLLIVGGGSAINYIESVRLGGNSLKSKYWLYAAMPSGDAYRIIAEEAVKNYEEYSERPYYPIVLSAQKAQEKDFLITTPPIEFRNAGIVVGIQLGFDWLVAYGSKDIFPKNMIISDTAILATSLDSIIANQITLLDQESDSIKKDKFGRLSLGAIKPITPYTTTDNSGTLNSYFRLCDSLTLRKYLSSKIGRHTFSDIDTLPKQSHESNWIALGSKHYHPKNKIMDSLTMLNSLDSIQTKPIYVYFMMYQDGEKYVLPNATKEFLGKIKVHNSIIDSIKNIEITDKILYDNFSAIKQQ